VGDDLVREVPVLTLPGTWSGRTAALTAFVSIAILDVVRAYGGRGLRPWQWAAGLLTAALLWSWLEERGLSRRERAPWVALALCLIPTYVDHARVLDRGDSTHYYSYLRSLLFDGDLQLANDYELLGWPEAAALPNVLPIGAPLLWSPLILVVHLLRHAAMFFGFGAPNGTEPVYQAMVAFATLLYGTAGLFLLMHTLRRWVGPWAAFWATVIAWIGSPLRFYLSVLPGTAHGVEFFAAVLVLRAYLALRDRPDRHRAFLAGAACGLAFLTRSQDGLLLLVPAIELARQLARRVDARRVILAGGVLVIAFVVVALPQMAVWQAMFGTPVLIPHKAIHGAQFLHAAQPELLGTLVSERGGLFASHPAMLLAVLGLMALAFRDTRYVLAVVPVLLATWYLNASVFDWYHVRRFTGVVPLLAPGLAVVIAPIAHWAVVTGMIAFAFLRYDVAVDTLRSVPGDPAPLRPVVREMGDGLVADVYYVLEPIAPRAAALVVARYTMLPMIGYEPVRIDLAAPTAVRLPVRARNLSAPSTLDGWPCRWVRGEEARLFLPVAARTPLVMTVTAAPADAEAAMVIEVSWMGTPIGAHPMTPGWAEYRFDVPEELVRAGTNVVTLAFRRPDGPRREVRRSAAVASLTVEGRQAN
jgi:hypothetical protein